MGQGQTTSWRLRQQRKANLARKMMMAAELWEGSYVKILTGEHEGLYGWVIGARHEGMCYQVAVCDRPPKRGGLYRWFSVTDVWLAAHERNHEDDVDINELLA